MTWGDRFSKKIWVNGDGRVKGVEGVKKWDVFKIVGGTKRGASQKKKLKRERGGIKERDQLKVDRTGAGNDLLLPGLQPTRVTGQIIPEKSGGQKNGTII